MNEILELLDTLTYETPYTASQGENGYRVLKAGTFELRAIQTFQFVYGDLETATATYKLLPSRFSETDMVLYKFNK